MGKDRKSVEHGGLNESRNYWGQGAVVLWLKQQNHNFSTSLKKSHLGRKRKSVEHGGLDESRTLQQVWTIFKKSEQQSTILNELRNYWRRVAVVLWLRQQNHDLKFVSTNPPLGRPFFMHSSFWAKAWSTKR